MTKKPQEAPKERGCWLTGWLILMAILGYLVKDKWAAFGIGKE